MNINGMLKLLNLKYNEKYDILIPIFLNKMYYEYYINRNLKEYNLDNLYKKYLPLLYVLIKNIKLIYGKNINNDI